ncbi:MAG: BldC family transcriptional regulator [Streptosporangiales bacterium]|nr:BldC family transcriptional regulator [Streptosporangiales bacterium]
MKGRAVNPDEHRLLTATEVAELFRVDPRTVTRWALSGRLKSIRTPGGHRRFSEHYVQALLRGEHDGSAERSTRVAS